MTTPVQNKPPFYLPPMSDDEDEVVLDPNLPSGDPQAELAQEVAEKAAEISRSFSESGLF